MAAIGVVLVLALLVAAAEYARWDYHHKRRRGYRDWR